MLGLYHSLLRFCTLLIFVFFHLHERRAKLRGIPLPTHVESFNASILEARLHEIFRSYGCEWRWKLSQLCLVRSIPWKAARIECHLPQKLKSEDHIRPWFYPKLVVFPSK